MTPSNSLRHTIDSSRQNPESGPKAESPFLAQG